MPDYISSFTRRFRTLSPLEAAWNPDSYARLVTRLASGDQPPTAEMSVGAALGGGASSRAKIAFAEVNPRLELHFPVLAWLSPSIGVSVAMLGEPATSRTRVGGQVITDRGGSDAGSRGFVALQPGLRIDDPRPGPSGGPFVRLQGGPALGLGQRPEGGGAAALGSKITVVAGYHYGALDFEVHGMYLHDPLRDPGDQDITAIGVGISALTLGGLINP